MCNTREENAAELAQEAALPVVNITRAELIDKLVDYRTDDFDGHDIDEAVRYGRDGYEEYTNEELEQQALDYMMEEGGAEVEYHITDADTSKPAGKVNQELLEALKNRYQALPRSSRPIWWTDDAAWLEYVEADERARAAIAKAEGI